MFVLRLFCLLIEKRLSHDGSRLVAIKSIDDQNLSEEIERERLILEKKRMWKEKIATNR